MVLSEKYFVDAYKNVDKEAVNYITAKVASVAEEEHIDLSKMTTIALEFDGAIDLCKPTRLYNEKDSGECVLQCKNIYNGNVEEIYVSDLSSNILMRLIEEL